MVAGASHPDLVSWLEGDPEAHDPKAAGWWLYVAACGIGDPFGGGPWRVVEGHLVDTRRGAGSAPGTPAEGVNRELPHLGDAGRGVHRALPHLGDAGQGRLEDLTAYMRALADRLATVRITGSWERVVKPSVLRATAGGDGSIAVFLDPPYATSGDLYAGTTDTEVATAVREWAETQTGYRIILCGYENEHDTLITRGWSKVDGHAGGGAGYSTDKAAGRRERLWLSPECVGERTLALFEDGAA